jgi:hypothetical protein
MGAVSSSPVIRPIKAEHVGPASRRGAAVDPRGAILERPCLARTIAMTGRPIIRPTVLEFRRRSDRLVNY